MNYDSYSKDELINLLGEKNKAIKQMESTFGSSYLDDFKSKANPKFGDSLDWIEQSPVCTKIVDLNFNLQYMSKAGIDGLHIEDITEYYGKPYPLNFYPEIFKSNMHKALTDVVNDRKVSQVLDEPMNDIHGVTHTFNSTLIPIFKKNNDLNYIIVVSINVSDMKKAEKEKMELQRRFHHSSKLASLGEIAAGVGHEINNPLAIAVGFASRIKKSLDINSNEVLENSFQKIDIAHERIASIVQQLRNYARVDPDEIKPFLVSDTVTQVVLMLKEIYSKQDIELIFNNLKEDIYCYGNAGRFQQAVMNLTSNARDALVDVENKKIIISLNMINETKASLSITDNGAGISKEVQEKMFDPFFTTKKFGEGTGMGMGIVLSMINEIDGKIDVRSSKIKGTTIEIEFPISLD